MTTRDEITFDVPNLDDASMDAADYEVLADTLRKLAMYATSKAAAIGFRKSGNIASALQHEARLERLYDDLPEWARW